MGRKKRKVAIAGAESSGTGADVIPPPPPPPPLPPPPVDPRMMRQQPPKQEPALLAANGADKNSPEDSASKTNPPDNAKKMSSSYATTSHSAEIIDEDIYVSDGSESDEDLMADKLDILSPNAVEDSETADDSENVNKTNIAGRSIEMVLSGSKMGLMRRGIHRPQLLVQPNRQWARQTTTQQDSQNDNTEDGGDVGDGSGAETTDDPSTAEEKRKREQEEELAKLDPAQRAVRLLAEKQRKLEEAKILARKLESEENAGRDPCLFSKRTSFDIRFDQIDDKPWLRGAGDITDFFNYGFSEEDWLEYAEQQLIIRQELIDANRQKRAPDPSIVPVLPKKPKKQNPRVAVAGSNAEGTEDDAPSNGMDVDGANEGEGSKGDEEDESSPTVIGPVLKKGTKDDKTETNAAGSAAAKMEGPTMNEAPSSSNDLPDIEIGAGGAWGMGAAPGLVLAKLIEEQDKQQQWNNSQKQNENNQRQDAMHDPPPSADSSSPRKGGRGTDYYGGGNNSNNSNNKYENNPSSSYYGNGGGGDGSGGGYNNNQADQQDEQQQYGGRYGGADGNRNHRHQNHGGHTDRNNNNNNSGGSQPNNNNDWNGRNNDRGHHQGWNDGGRGGYRSGGNRGGSGRRGGGDYADGKGRSRGGGYGDRGGGYQRRKRPRDDYDDRYSRR